MVSCTPGRIQLVVGSRSILPTEVLLRVLLACLVRVNSRRCLEYYRGVRTFAGLLTFWPMTFHLLASYSLIAASSAALFFFVSMRRDVSDTCILHLLQIRHNAYPYERHRQHYAMMRARCLTLYQCFFTLPSVRCGNVYDNTVST
jgi:hypothetical protein